MDRLAGQIFAQLRNTPEEQKLIDERMRMDREEALQELLERRAPSTIYTLPELRQENREAVPELIEKEYLVPGSGPVMAMR